METQINKIPLVRLQMVKEKEIPYGNEKLNSPQKAADFARKLLQDADREYLVVCGVDTGGHPVILEIAAIGTINACLTEPREIYKSMILCNAAFIMVFHNHPSSGIVGPSEADRKITTRLKECGKMLGIPLLDHIILGDSTIYSFKEEGSL